MPHDHHDHGTLSPSVHPYRADDDGPLTYWQRMETAVRELLVEKGVATPAEIAAQIERMDARSPALGARVVARACTLCSCYPRNLLGLPPDWYKARAYRARTVREPRRVLAEFGLELPEGVRVRVHDSTADMRYLVVPARPEGTEGWSEEALAGLVTRDAMIGTARARAPAEAAAGGDGGA